MRASSDSSLVTLDVCDCTFAIRCGESATAAIVRRVFGAFLTTETAAPLVAYHVARANHRGYRIEGAESAATVSDVDGLLYHLDKDITLTLQHRRRDLLFVHAAVIARGGRAIVLPAASGTGKSTLTLAAVRSGFDYLSDELAPIDAEGLSVSPFPRALCLKSPPPAPYLLPARTIQIDRRFHVPLHRVLLSAAKSVRLGALVFLRRDGGFRGLRPVTAATAAAMLTAHTLNGRAHSGFGLDAAIRLGRELPSFELDITDLRQATRGLDSVM